MGSKRGHKAKKRAQREARRHTRRGRSGARSAAAEDHAQVPARQPASPIVTAPEELAPYMVPQAHRPTTEAIGYLAHDGQDFLCKNGECLVAASAALMRRTAAQAWPDTPVVIRGLTFEELCAAMEATGEAFCFDDASYARFVEAARHRERAMGDLPQSDLHLLFP